MRGPSRSWSTTAAARVSTRARSASPSRIGARSSRARPTPGRPSARVRPRSSRSVSSTAAHWRAAASWRPRASRVRARPLRPCASPAPSRAPGRPPRRARSRARRGRARPPRRAPRAPRHPAGEAEGLRRGRCVSPGKSSSASGWAAADDAAGKAGHELVAPSGVGEVDDRVAALPDAARPGQQAADGVALAACARDADGGAPGEGCDLGRSRPWQRHGGRGRSSARGRTGQTWVTSFAMPGAPPQPPGSLFTGLGRRM